MKRLKAVEVGFTWAAQQDRRQVLASQQWEAFLHGDTPMNFPLSGCLAEGTYTHCKM